MSEKRFTMKGSTILENGEEITAWDCCELLNEQQATIDKLDQENADLLGARIKAQEEWEKCTDKLKAKILEQQSIITALKEENIELKKLRKYCAEWMGVKEENLYDVVR